MTTNMSHPLQVLPGKRRGRKAGVKTVSDEVLRHRRAWLTEATKEKGQNITLCHLLKAPDSFVSHLTAGRRTFTNAITARIETALGLPLGTIDSSGVAVECDNSSPAVPTHITPSSVPLEPGLADALQNLMATALAQNKISNTVAVKFINELVTLCD